MLRFSREKQTLDYTLLPPYEIPGLIVVSGLVVQNRNQATLHNIKILIEYESPSAVRIHHMQVFSDTPYILRGGGEQHSFATLRLKAMDPGARVVVYFATSKPLNPKVTVTSFEE